MPSPFKNPDLMVIGDSLAQGCRSLSINARVCKESYSAVIARAQNWTFNSPAFPRDVIYDLEDIIRNYVSPLGILAVPLLFRRLQRNLDDWCAHFANPPATGPEWCDNLAVAGASLREMDLFTWNRSRDIVAASAGKDILPLVRSSKNTLANLHLAINSGFVLNPCGKAKYADWNMLQWVAERQPRHLIVHMGHNDGLYPIGSNAEPVDISKTTAQKYIDYIDGIEQATKIGQKLIFILLPKISSVANLAVPNVGSGPDAHGYWPRYKPVFSTSAREFDAAGMKAMDDGIKAANIKIRTRLQELQDRRDVRVIEAYDILEAKDFKNSRDPKRQIVIGQTTVDNFYLDGESYQVPGGGNPVHGHAPAIRWRFERGGFQSIDGMHPSAVGYAEVAIEIMKSLNWNFQKDAVRRTALRKEKLIGSFPGGLLQLLAVLQLFRQIPRRTEDGGLPSDGDPKTDTAHIILAAQRCACRS